MSEARPEESAPPEDEQTAAVRRQASRLRYLRWVLGILMGGVILTVGITQIGGIGTAPPEAARNVSTVGVGIPTPMETAAAPPPPGCSTDSSRATAAVYPGLRVPLALEDVAVIRSGRGVEVISARLADAPATPATWLVVGSDVQSANAAAVTLSDWPRAPGAFVRALRGAIRRSQRCLP